MPFGQTKVEVLIRTVSVPYLVKLILSGLTINHAFYSISSNVINKENNNKMNLQLISILIWKIELQIIFFVSMKILIKP